MKDGKVRRAYLGIGTQRASLSRHAAHQLNTDLETAVFVISVERDSPASRAGVQEGDIIVAIDDQAVSGMDDLLDSLDARRIGHDSELTVLRSRAILKLTVRPGESKQ
jgi:S1-C subfamily serine protease